MRKTIFSGKKLDALERNSLKDYYIGIMSGNSLDAIDLVLTSFSPDKPTLHSTLSVPIPGSIKKKVRDINLKSNLEVLVELDYELACLFADGVNKFIKHSGIDYRQVKAIGSHGQTVLHGPTHHFPHSYQLGDANIIAAKTKIKTISDFRRKDIALGGQGAPLAPIFHRYAFGSKHHDTVVLNIGGIANITHIDSSAQIKCGYDTGPGNILIDMVARLFFSCGYDENGEIARSGRCVDSLLKDMLADQYFLNSFPKSSGRDYFNMAWLSKFSFNDYDPKDLICTLTHLTAKSIAKEVNSIASSCDLVLSGGGSANIFLIDLLKRYCDSQRVKSSSDLGIDPQLVEAMLFAYLAKLHIDGEVVDMSAVTGANLPYHIGISFTPPLG